MIFHQPCITRLTQVKSCRVVVREEAGEFDAERSSARPFLLSSAALS